MRLGLAANRLHHHANGRGRYVGGTQGGQVGLGQPGRVRLLGNWQANNFDFTTTELRGSNMAELLLLREAFGLVAGG